MNLKSMEIFLHVCETGSLTKAAVALGLTQPSVSRSITSLEEQLGGALLLRTGRGVVLTELGEAALPRIRSLLNQVDEMYSDLGELGRSPGGTVSIGILPSMIPPLVGKLFLQLRRKFPQIRLRIFEGFSNQIEEWLATGHVDIGLLAHYRSTNLRREGEELLRSRLMLVGLPDQQMAPEVHFAELAQVPLVLPARPNGLRLMVDDTADRMRVELNVVMDAGGLVAPKELVRCLGYYTLLNRETITEELALGTLNASPIVKPELFRRVFIATTKQHPLSRSAREVVRTIRQIYQA